MTLQMRDRENIEKGIEQGIEKGRRKLIILKLCKMELLQKNLFLF